LVTSAGTWTFGTAADSYGNAILLNGASAGNGFSQELEVANQGQLYAESGGQWWDWNGSGWVSTSNPNGSVSPPNPSSPSPDGSTLTVGQSGNLVTSAGTWTFGTATDSYGSDILLNGASAANGFSQELEVANQGQVYAESGGQWWAWNGSGWSGTNDPNSAPVSPTTLPPLTTTAAFQNLAQSAAATSIDNATSINSSGYDAVAWKNGAADQHGVGYADLSGDLSGSDPSLEALEPRSKADFNDDVTIGIPHASTLEALDAMVGIPHASTLEALDPIFQQDLNGNGASGTPSANSTTEPYGTAAAHFDPQTLQDSLATWVPLASHGGRA
jgi:hypothetical protein